MNNRAYSLMQVKAVNEDSREITGIASTPEPDRYGDIVDPRRCEIYSSAASAVATLA